MKRDEHYRFEILVSMFKRHDRACKSDGNTEFAHSLDNVQYKDNHVEIRTTTGQFVILNGTVLNCDRFEIPIDRIERMEWITRDPDGIDPMEFAFQKQDHFDRIHIYFSNDWITIDGLGQSVFPIMQFLTWAAQHG